MMSISLNPARIALIAAALALGACSQGPLDDSAIDLNAQGGGLGAASDPTSPSYFNAVVGDRVLFLVDQSTLTDTARATLDGQAQWLLTNPEYTALIEGHADEQGTREYNLALGARRAAAVQSYLVSRGVPESRMRTISYGKERPLEICSQEACYAQNRRGVTVVSAGLGA